MGLNILRNPALVSKESETDLRSETEAVGGEAVEPAKDNGLASPAPQQPQTPLPAQNSSSPADVKSYKNTEYEFEFTYPASFGEVAEKIYQCPRGFMTIGTFIGNPNIDFGFVSSDYEKCAAADAPLFEILKYDLLDKKLKLYSSNPVSPTVEVTIEQVIPTRTANILAYIIKNTIEADGNGSPAAVLKSPNPAIGPLIFRTHGMSHGMSYEDGIKLLEAIIQN